MTIFEVFFSQVETFDLNVFVVILTRTGFKNFKVFLENGNRVSTLISVTNLKPKFHHAFILSIGKNETCLGKFL